MREDKEGFLYPFVKKELCVNCDLCISVCPFQRQEEEITPLRALAAESSCDRIRVESSSGGIFSLIAERVLDEGGIVFGALFDDRWNVRHGCIENTSELWKLRGSKYVQSFIGDSFELAEYQLKKGRSVLFSGTPCQISGLRHYLGKDYDKLITVDFICHGVPSPRLWRWYLNKVKNDVFPFISSISFRNKDNGWRRYSLAFDIVQSGTVERQHCYHREDPYMKAFLGNLSLRPSCSSCYVKSGKSHSDISLADFWNVEKVISKADDDKGVSLVLANTIKGDSFLNLIDGVVYQVVDFRQAVQYNKAWRESFPMNPNRKSFFAQYKIHRKDFNHFVEIKLQPKNGFYKRVKKEIKLFLSQSGK